ncbi:hypothetical protein LCGC14_1471420 [marine sediment metagenome]|uniref:Uncharacterized protein n=1 Tax=marine sediment metagenome TaxID=412755 RepID=A0A0F9LSR1_9ZZZZ
MEVPNDIFALFERSKEHLGEMKTEYGICIEEGFITPRAKIITHQALSLCRNALDHAMRCYWNQEWYNHLSITQQSSYNLVYFPVAWSKEDLRRKLKNYKMKDLKICKPTVYKFLADCQAFNNVNYIWLQQLNSLAGKGKHEHLIEQNRKDYTHYTLEFAPEGKVMWRVSTTKVDPENLAQTRKQYINSEELPENVGLKETIIQRPSFRISEINQEALLFCYEAQQKSIKLITDFFQLF